ncbi:unnamed protein product, partial [Effrenium voratum]
CRLRRRVAARGAEVGAAVAAALLGAEAHGEEGASAASARRRLALSALDAPADLAADVAAVGALCGASARRDFCEPRLQQRALQLLEEESLPELKVSEVAGLCWALADLRRRSPTLRSAAQWAPMIRRLDAALEGSLAGQGQGPHLRPITLSSPLLAQLCWALGVLLAAISLRDILGTEVLRRLAEDPWPGRFAAKALWGLAVLGFRPQDAGDLARLSLGYAGRLEGDGVVQLAIAWSRWGAPEELRQALRAAAAACDFSAAESRQLRLALADGQAAPRVAAA